ncbi:MAG: xanthine dehydrogenase family protein subunit M [Thermoleophilia bacterium]
MKLSPFQLHRPQDLPETAALMERNQDDAVLYAGGTELLLVMKLGLADHGHLVDIKGIPELHRLEVEGGDLVIGGCVTHRELERSELVRRHLPALAEMERGVANVRVRVSGTLGGNLAFADPHSDPATFLLAVGAVLEVRGAAGTRAMPMGDFILGPYHTVLEPGDLIAAVRVPLPPQGTAIAHRKLAFHERPAVTVTCVLSPAPGGGIARASVAVGSVGLTPMRLPAAEAVLAGGGGAGDQLQAAAAGECLPTADANGAVDYKRHLVGVLVRRAAADALAELGG